MCKHNTCKSASNAIFLQSRLHASYRKRKAPSRRQAPGQAEAEAEVEAESTDGTVEISDTEVDTCSKLTQSHTAAQQSRGQPAVSTSQRDVTSRGIRQSQPAGMPERVDQPGTSSRSKRMSQRAESGQQESSSGAERQIDNRPTAREPHHASDEGAQLDHSQIQRAQQLLQQAHSGPQQEQIGTQRLINEQANHQLQLQDRPIVQLRQQVQERPLLDQDRPASSQEQRQSSQPLQRANSTEHDVEVELQSSEGQQGLAASQNDAHDNADCDVIDGKQRQPAKTHRMNRHGTPQSLSVASQGAQSQQSCQRQTTPHTIHPISTQPRRYDAQDGSARGSCIQSMGTYHTGPDVDPDPEPSDTQGPQDADTLELSDYNEAQLRQAALDGIDNNAN